MVLFGPARCSDSEGQAYAEKRALWKITSKGLLQLRDSRILGLLFVHSALLSNAQQRQHWVGTAWQTVVFWGWPGPEIPLFVPS